MRRGLKVKLSYSGDMPETVVFDMRDAALTPELAGPRAVRRQARCMPTSTIRRRKRRLDRGIGRGNRRRLPGRIRCRSKAHRVRPTFIAEYIRCCQRVGELGSWTVRLVSSKTGQLAKIGPYEIGLIERAAINDPAAEERYRIRRIVSPSDESTDLGPRPVAPRAGRDHARPPRESVTRTATRGSRQCPTGMTLRR